MKLLLDMCLSAALVADLEAQGHQASHWSKIGEATAKDSAIMRWAAEHDLVLISADLDFGDLLALTKADKPSVILLRCDDHAPLNAAPLLIETIKRFNKELIAGCLISVDESTARIRALPFI